MSSDKEKRVLGCCARCGSQERPPVRCWSWNSSTLATSCEELTHWKRLWCWEGLGAGGEGEDEMAGWHHWHDGRESEWTQGVGDRQGGLAYCDSWGRKESDMTERLNWTELNFFSNKLCESFSSTSVWFVSVEDKKLEVYKGLPRWRCSWACHWVLSLLDPLSSFTGIPAG